MLKDFMIFKVIIFANSQDSQDELLRICNIPASAAHIHVGAEGQNGEVIADILNTPASQVKDTHDIQRKSR